jgi:hypothetical protein
MLFGKLKSKSEWFQNGDGWDGLALSRKDQTNSPRPAVAAGQDEE